MIISHKHKFIFIKTRKTAGTSIEIALSNFCGKDDIITPISPKDEEIRKKSGLYPQNYVKEINEYNFRDYLSIFKGKKPNKFYNHMSAKEVKDIVGNNIWDNYYKFCFDRNPWDKVVSLYHFQKRVQGSDVSFDTWFNQNKYNLAYNFPLYTDEYNELMVDFVGTYENLKNDLDFISSKVGLNIKDYMTFAKGGYREKNKYYDEYYDETKKNKIHEKFLNEIETFHYKF